MNQSELIAHIAKEAGITKSKASLFLKTFGAIAFEEVTEKGIFNIPGIGKLTTVPPPTEDDTSPTPDIKELDRKVAKIRKRGVPKNPKGVKKPQSTYTTSRQYYRDPEIKAWLLHHANGCCEQCGEKAPFLGLDGTPYLEEHHVVLLAEGGSDRTSNAVALCPNCHRRCHLSRDREHFIESLYAKVGRLKKE